MYVYNDSLNEEDNLILEINHYQKIIAKLKSDLKKIQRVKPKKEEDE